MWQKAVLRENSGISIVLHKDFVLCRWCASYTWLKRQKVSKSGRRNKLIQHTLIMYLAIDSLDDDLYQYGHILCWERCSFSRNCLYKLQYLSTSAKRPGFCFSQRNFVLILWSYFFVEIGNHNTRCLQFGENLTKVRVI